MSKPLAESLKEIWRWVYSYILTALFYALIGLVQKALPFFPVNLFPEKFLIIGFTVPIRMLVQNLIIPAIIRALDKYKYTDSKDNKYPGEESKGLFGFNLLNGL